MQGYFQGGTVVFEILISETLTSASLVGIREGLNSDKIWLQEEIDTQGLVDLLKFKGWPDLCPGLWLIRGALWMEDYEEFGPFSGKAETGFTVEDAFSQEKIRLYEDSAKLRGFVWWVLGATDSRSDSILKLINEKAFSLLATLGETKSL